MIKMNNLTYNMDKLPLEVVGMLYFLFSGEIEGFEDVYMVEIKLDDPIEHIKNEDEYFILHNGPNQYESNAKYLFDYDWAIIHKNVFDNIDDVNKKRFKQLLNKYFEIGSIFKKEEKIP